MRTPLRNTDSPPASPETRLDASIANARDALARVQADDGHWRFELEADATIPAEYILMVHYLGETADPVLEEKIAVYLRRVQGGHGGWPLVHEGAFDISASVKAYFALKMIGDDTEAPHMRAARTAILAHGGAATANVFTRILMALYGQVPWRAVPMMPVEIMMLPKWFPFHLSKISYWARTVIVPLLVLQTLKPRARNPRGVGISELFVTPPQKVRHWVNGAHQSGPWPVFFGGLDKVLRLLDPLFPRGLRLRSIARARQFVTNRLNGEDGLGAIFPAMVNALLMYDALGDSEDQPERAAARVALAKLLVIGEKEAYCQPCVSPVWDTALACHALMETGDGTAVAAAKAGQAWLRPLQELEVRGDWAEGHPDVRPGGWAFQYANAYYPDLDDTAVIVMALDRQQQGEGGARDATAIARARDWIVGLQSRDGGWAAFDADNTHHYLNQIPFADHGALLDPPTADVTARCISMLAQLGEPAVGDGPLARAIRWLIADQREDGSWYGRWGMNYIYGTWSALSALNAAGFGPETAPVRTGADWLAAIQNPDGGWGEQATSYALDYAGYEPAPSTPSQTAWALLALMAAGRENTPEVSRGIAYLQANQHPEGLWQEALFTATGFPRVFYLRYHGYAKYFPLWALARYRNLTRANAPRQRWGM